MESKIERYVTAVPKVELHVHLFYARLFDFTSLIGRKRSADHVSSIAI
jgi:hypothetical protein